MTVETPTAELPSKAPAPPAGVGRAGAGSLAPYVVLGIAFGIVLTKSEVVSWFRIQEMFRFGSFHMYGVLMSAVAVAAAAMWVIRRAASRALNGEPIGLPRKAGLVRYPVGGTVFGIGWALTGACPGPLFALVGSGLTVVVVALASAVVGTLVYGLVKPRLPH